MLQTVNANEGRTSWPMRTVLLVGGLTMLSLPAVYLSRASVVQAEDPPKAAPVDGVGVDPFEEEANAPPAADSPPNPFGRPRDEASAAARPPIEAPRARATAPDGNPFGTPRAARVSTTIDHVSEPSVEFLPEPSQNEKLILAALDRKVTIEFVEMPLAKVAAFLEDVLEKKIQIQLDNRALEDAGMGAETPVTRTVKDVKLRTALKLVLDELDLTYLIRDDVFLITTVDKADTELLTRTYPVADLLEVAAEARSAPKARGGGAFQIADKPAAANPQAAATPGSLVTSKATPAAEPVAAAESAPKELHGVGGGEVPAVKSGSQRARATREQNSDPYDTLIETIITTVKPQTWDEVGGPGSITAVPVARSLVISQTRDVHDEILDLIRSLRAAKRASSPRASDE